MLHMDCWIVQTKWANSLKRIILLNAAPTENTFRIIWLLPQFSHKANIWMEKYFIIVTLLKMLLLVFSFITPQHCHEYFKHLPWFKGKKGLWLLHFRQTFVLMPWPAAQCPENTVKALKTATTHTFLNGFIS